MPSVTEHNFQGIQTEQTNVSIPGTAVPLTAMAIPQGSNVIVRAKKSNTMNIYLANSGPHAIDHTVAFPLAPGEAVTLSINNAAACFIDADVANEGVALLSEAPSV